MPVPVSVTDTITYLRRQIDRTIDRIERQIARSMDTA
jgi:hypothetical protein